MKRGALSYAYPVLIIIIGALMVSTYVYWNGTENLTFPEKREMETVVSQRQPWIAVILSILLGFLGVDWFYLSCGNGWYILTGIVKLLTLGGCGIWWLVDWIRILAEAFPDGTGAPLKSFTT